MYKKNVYTIKDNTPLTPNIYKMILIGDTQHITASGQFINIELPNKFLRRPISVCDYDDTTITIIYKIVGEGTEIMSQMKSGDTLDILTGLGNGFDTNVRTRHPLLVGGGVGIPPLYNLCKRLIAEGKRPTVIMGFNTADESFLFEEFCSLGIDVFVSTADGTGGTHGFVTDAMEKNCVIYDYIFACGPKPMLQALWETSPCEGQLSFEERMGCGFGACVGCSIETKQGIKRVCKEGPIFLKSEIIF